MQWRAIVLSVSLLSAVAWAGPKQKLIVLNFSVSDASLRQLADSLSEQVLTEIGRSGRVDAIGQSDVASVLGLERQKQMLGCSDQASSCLAEVSAAMGAQWIVTGFLARLGKTIRIDMKLIHANDGHAAYRDGRNPRDEAEVFETVSAMVREMMARDELRVSGAVSQPEVEVSSSGGVEWPEVAQWSAVGLGAVAAGIGVFFSVTAAGQWNNLNDPAWKAQNEWSQVQATGSSFNTNVVLGPTLIGVGLALAGAGLGWNLASSSSSAEPSVTVAPTSNGFAVGGTF